MYAMAFMREDQYWPLEIWILILCKLPVELLVRCRLVCKAWHHLIGTTFFVNTHLNYQKTSPNTNKYVLHVQSFDSILSTDCEAIFDEPYYKDSKLYYTPESFGRDCTSERTMAIWEICDGLLCVSDRWYQVGNDIHLWNPICRKAKKLPKLEISLEKDVGFDKSAAISFGYYDDDYKVIVISSFKTYIVSVYSLRSNCWRTFPSNIPSYINFLTKDGFRDYERTRFIEGTAYMLTCLKRVVYFDLRDEISRQLELPERINRGRLQTLAAYGEKLAVFVCGQTEIGLWILKDKYLSTSPWEKKFNIKLQGIYPQQMIGFLHNGKYMISAYTAAKNKTMYYLCDPESPKLIEFKPPDGPPRCFSNIVPNCVESLLLLNIEDSLDPFVDSRIWASYSRSRLFTFHNQYTAPGKFVG